MDDEELEELFEPEVEGESELEYLGSCPCCERKFKRHLDYPLLFIKSFERLEIPEIVSDPEHEWWYFFKLDEGSGKINYNKILGYYGGISNKEISPLPKEVKDYLQSNDKITFQGKTYEKIELRESSQGGEDLVRISSKEIPDLLS